MEQKDDGKQQTKRDSGTTPKSGSKMGAIASEEDWGRMKTYDASCTLDESEQAIRRVWRKEVAKRLDGVEVHDASGNWGIALFIDWLRMKNYDVGLGSKGRERAIEMGAREVVATRMKGVAVYDTTGYWAIVPAKDWIVMRKRLSNGKR